jgi:hypothetical protein
VVNLLKDELKEDVSAMKKVVKKGNTDTVWDDVNKEKGTRKEKDELINELRDRISGNENTIASQDLDSLKN